VEAGEPSASGRPRSARHLRVPKDAALGRRGMRRKAHDAPPSTMSYHLVVRPQGPRSEPQVSEAPRNWGLPSAALRAGSLHSELTSLHSVLASLHSAWPRRHGNCEKGAAGDGKDQRD